MPIATYSVHVAIKIVKGGVWQPGFVEMQCVDLAIEDFLERFDVVDDAIVGALRNRQNAWLAVRMVLAELPRQRDWHRFSSECFQDGIRPVEWGRSVPGYFA